MCVHIVYWCPVCDTATGTGEQFPCGWDPCVGILTKPKYLFGAQLTDFSCASQDCPLNQLCHLGQEKEVRDHVAAQSEGKFKAEEYDSSNESSGSFPSSASTAASPQPASEPENEANNDDNDINASQSPSPAVQVTQSHKNTHRAKSHKEGGKILRRILNLRHKIQTQAQKSYSDVGIWLEAEDELVHFLRGCRWRCREIAKVNPLFLIVA
ncbi:hypothetical protein QBC46DRAFT_410901 [Diplogelasinospora grovesii]|uniref:Uncharacterized protein n=1 Tax=Diplogelasinospora grovesii TaxID=303347 RepID=A0AAN6S257_9PEZI|nr:hypothetical protein QBC46DRAFT_410901 [Diplogelasinospora grovesii]